MKSVILITGASSGFGALTARALARAGHTVYASMRDIAHRNASAADEAARYAKQNNVDLRAIELDVQSEESADAAVEQIVRNEGRLDVVVHNAGHMVFGPTEAFTPDQLAHLYDVNVLSTQRVNRAALPQLRTQKQGLVIWVGSSSTNGGVPLYLAPYFAAKAGMEALAVSYAKELARWGVETSIVIPGAFTSGTNHFAHSGRPDDQERVRLYREGPYAGGEEQAVAALAATVPPGADVCAVAQAIVEIVDTPFGKRPFRVTIDPAQDGSEVVTAVMDRIRAEFTRRLGFKDLLHPAELV